MPCPVGLQCLLPSRARRYRAPTTPILNAYGVTILRTTYNRRQRMNRTIVHKILLVVVLVTLMGAGTLAGEGVGPELAKEGDGWTELGTIATVIAPAASSTT